MLLVSIPACLLFLSIQVVYKIFSGSSNLIATCIYLLFGCWLLNRYGNLFNKVIMLCVLILIMLTYIFILLSIIFFPFFFFFFFFLSNLFGKRNLNNGRYCHLVLLQLLGFSLPLLNHIVSWPSQGFLYHYLFGWYPGPGWLLSMQARGHDLFCAVCWFILGYILNFPSLNFISP